MSTQPVVASPAVREVATALPPGRDTFAGNACVSRIQSGDEPVYPGNPVVTSATEDSVRYRGRVAAACQNTRLSCHDREQSGIHKEL